MQKERSAGFLGFLHSFRGYAILCIVAGHAVAVIYFSIYRRYNMSDPVLILNEILFNQCTLYFALISGLLFSSVLKVKSYKKFYVSKVLYVFLPYLLFTLLYTFVRFQRHNFVHVDMNTMDFVADHILQNILYGRANFVLWYIPVLFGLYLLTPLYSYLLSQKKYTNILLCVIILLPLISTGFKIPILFGSTIGKIIYFSGAYVLGMYLGENLEANIIYLKKKWLLILAIVLVSTIVLCYLHYYNVTTFKGINIQESVYYIQKICLAALVILFFKQLGEKQPVWLTKVAADSTPIYFIHGAIVMTFSSWFLFSGITEYVSLNIGVSSLLLLVFAVVLSMLISAVIKKIFGKKSRMIIGA